MAGLNFHQLWDAILGSLNFSVNNCRPHISLGYLTPAEYARGYYEKNREKEVKQPMGASAKARNLSLQVIL